MVNYSAGGELLSNRFLKPNNNNNNNNDQEQYSSIKNINYNNKNKNNLPKDSPKLNPSVSNSLKKNPSDVQNLIESDHNKETDDGGVYKGPIGF
jgi:hypothetical protein